MAKRRKRKWSLGAWTENSNELTAVATRAQLPKPEPNSSSRGRGGSSGSSGGNGGSSGGSRRGDSRDGGGPEQTELGALKRGPELGALKSLDVVAFNAQAEQLFCRLLAQLIDESETKEIRTIDAIRECAFALDVSTETIKRYLLKHSARNAMFAVSSGVVRLK